MISSFVDTSNHSTWRISKSDLKPVFKDPLEGDIQKSHADTSLINQKLGWRIEVELEDWLKNNMFNNEIDKTTS